MTTPTPQTDALVASYASNVIEVSSGARKIYDLARKLEQERDSYRLKLTNLLCRIHRDGGHYFNAHGLDKAFDDADTIVADLNANSDSYREQNTNLREQLVQEEGKHTELQRQLDSYREKAEELSLALDGACQERFELGTDYTPSELRNQYIDVARSKLPSGNN
jgi:hypothetical protein